MRAPKRHAVGVELLREIEARFGEAPCDGSIEDIYAESNPSGSLSLYPFLVIQTYHTDNEPHYAFLESADAAAEYVDDGDASLCWVLRAIVDVRDGTEILVTRAYSFRRIPFDVNGDA